MGERQKSNDILTLKEASEFLKLSKSTLYNLARKGKVPARRVGRSWRFVKLHLIRWLESKDKGDEANFNP